MSDDQLHQMSLEQKQLRVKIRNTTDVEKMKELKQKKEQYSEKHDKKS